MGDKLPVVMRSQETNMWCWAASGEMIMDFLGSNVSQCDQANRRFGESECCLVPVPGKCVLGGWPEFEKYGFAYDRTTSKAVDWNTIVDNISAKKTPIAFSWRWLGGGGHMMIVIGYAIIGDAKYVVIHDPWPPNVGATKTILYDDFVSGPKYTHWDDFYNIRSNDNPSGGTFGMGEYPGQIVELFPGQREATISVFGAASKLLSEISGPGHTPGVLNRSCAIAYVRLDELVNLASVPGSPDLGAAVQPLLLGKRPSSIVYSSSSGGPEITVVQNSDSSEWRTSGFSTPDLFDRLGKVDIDAPGSSEATSYAIISIPAVNQQFVVLPQDGGPLFRALVDDPVCNFRTNESLTGVELLKRLVVAAQRHDGQPR